MNCRCRTGIFGFCISVKKKRIAIICQYFIMVFREVEVTVFTCETRFFEKIYGLVWLSYESNIPD